jgi:hypothetical protein
VIVPKTLKVEVTPDAELEIKGDYLEAMEENDGVAFSTSDRLVFEAMIRARRMERHPNDVNS